MPGQVRHWPAWPEFTKQRALEAEDPDFLTAKKAVVAQYGADALKQSWIAVCKELKTVTDEIAAKGQSIIPILNATELLQNGFTDEQKAKVKAIGSFVVQGVLPETEATAHYANLRIYVTDNKDKINGWPKESPSMLMLYDSPTQNAIRAHPNHLRLQRMLNELWHDSTAETAPEPLIYLDGARDRPPKQVFLGLGPHIDAGSLCRWADPTYRESYGHILAGKPELHDPYDLGARKNANQELYPGLAHSSVFRSFQGWTALTKAAPREGSLLIYPNVSTAIAYVLLRPFFTPPSQPEDVMDAEKWTLDESSGWFPGTFKTESQRLSRSSHPHLRLEECLVHMPRVNPGDTVWWHADACHAVDPEQEGSGNASVVYIAACPTTTNNKAYVKKQLEATRAGRPAPDYAEGNDLDETKLKGYVGIDDFSPQAKAAFGYGL
ncbi:hypothetical protein EDB81DRAFT_837801 [Dactylonectria macrodidyma]|uniref:DUF1479-domain-containing protein n=1 Tax=Dactylonectria macrodidyma TaxID=307937 RepID=A0A9P9JHZ7_9HYPO|nr:hypothetical protein EDB81DRAFT_837801 [Dactylonectria macrodidyma]